MSIVFVMTGACSISGGIAGVNLNILRVLSEIANEKKIKLNMLSLYERNNSYPSFLNNNGFNGFDGHKIKFGTKILKSVFIKKIFIFDHVTLTLPLLPFKPIRGVRTIIFAHGSESWRRIKKTSILSFKLADLVITNSHYTLRHMRERISKFNGVACPLGLSPEFSLNKEIPESLNNVIQLESIDGKHRTLGERMLLLVGRMHPDERKKGHYPLLKIMPELLREFPDVQLVFAGPGDDRENIANFAKRLRVASSVFLPGYVSTDMLKKLYQACFAYVMPSKQEGFGLVYLEAMNYGKPCIGCFDDGAEDVIIDGETGYLVHNPDDKDELLGVLRKLLSNPEQARMMGKKGFERLHSNFTAEHYQRRLKGLILRVID